MSDSIISVLNLFIAIAGVLFAYYKFFREGAHQQRIQFEIECIDLGINGGYRIIEIGIIASNKGHVEQKFDEIRLKVRGLINGQELTEIKNHEPRISFTDEVDAISVIPKKYSYFFVRPGVTQRFPVVIKIPASWRQLHARSTFKYFGLNEIHSAEHAFELALKSELSRT